MFKSVKCILLIIILVYAIKGEQQSSDDINHNSIDDDYTFVEPKRALLLSRIMVILQKAFDDSNNEKSRGESNIYNNDIRMLQPRSEAKLSDEEAKRIAAKTVGLQRRGHTSTIHPKGLVWRCYFNAVTCFKK